MKHPDLEEQVYRLHAEVCRALADPKRLRIIAALRQGELAVAQIAETLGISPSNASHHLSVLRRLSLVTARREGVNIHYSLASPKVMEACDAMRQVLSERLSAGARLSEELGTTAGGRR